MQLQLSFKISITILFNFEGFVSGKFLCLISKSWADRLFSSFTRTQIQRLSLHCQALKIPFTAEVRHTG